MRALGPQAQTGQAHVWVVKRVGGLLGRTSVTMECAVCGHKRVVRASRPD